MQIKFPKENFQKAIIALQKISQNKVNSNLPGSIYISAKNNTVEMQANDFELGISFFVDAQVIEEGTLVIASRYFQELIRKLPGSVVELNRPENTNLLTIKSGGSEISLLTLHVDDFTLIHKFEGKNNLTIDASEMKELIDLTLYAVSVDNDRPVFSGALLDVKNNEISMVATDTHRMAVKKILMSNRNDDEIRLILPNRLLSEVSRLLPLDNPALVKISYDRNLISFSFDSVYIIGRIIEGTYPEYEKVIPNQFDAAASISTKEFTGAIERISLMAKEMSYNVIRYDWNINELRLFSENVEVGMAKEELTCSFQGDPFSISFNSRYIGDILRHIKGEEINLYLKKNGPMVIRSNEQPNYTYVVTPVRTK